jgi:hypothetical protein
LDAAPSDSNVLAIGEDYGENNGVYVSTDGGDDWTLTSPLPIIQGLWIQDIEFNPSNSSSFYVIVERDGLFETTDRGSSWTNINNNLPWNHGNPDWISLPSVAINPLNPSNLFVSDVYLGVYQSHDWGRTWGPFNPGLDSALAFGKLCFGGLDTTRLILGASMRSVWSIHRTLEGVSQGGAPLPGKMSLAAYPNPFNASTLFNYNISESGPVTLAIYDLLGRKVAALDDGMHSPGPYSQAWDAGNLPSGAYFARLRAGGQSQTIKMTLVK